MTLDKKLNDAFEEMMKYRQSIGYATATYRSSVPPFINFCVKNHPLSARITQEMVDEWLTYYPYTVNSKAAFISLLREYSKRCINRIFFRAFIFDILVSSSLSKWRFCFERRN